MDEQLKELDFKYAYEIQEIAMGKNSRSKKLVAICHV